MPYLFAEIEPTGDNVASHRQTMPAAFGWFANKGDASPLPSGAESVEAFLTVDLG